MYLICKSSINKDVIIIIKLTDTIELKAESSVIGKTQAIPAQLGITDR